MRITILCLFISLQLQGQVSWPGYNYTYEIKTDPLYDTGSFTINVKLKSESILNITGSFLDKSQNPRMFVIFNFSTIDTTITHQADASGNFDINLPAKTYTLTLKGNLNFISGNDLILNKETNQKRIFVYQSNLNEYKIRSKNRLSMSKIRRIKRCVENRNSTDCNLKDSYFIDNFY